MKANVWAPIHEVENDAREPPEGIAEAGGGVFREAGLRHGCLLPCRDWLFLSALVAEPNLGGKGGATLGAMNHGSSPSAVGEMLHRSGESQKQKPPRIYTDQHG